MAGLPGDWTDVMSTPHMLDPQSLRSELLDRRRRLSRVVTDAGPADDVVRLLGEVDAALERLGGGTFGRCEVCGESVDDQDLMVHPLLQYCLCELSERQQAELQRDLNVAWRVQAALLPAPCVRFAGWEVHHRYAPAGPVSGDYCDVVTQAATRSLHLLLGDVAGKGVAASFLMARLSALFRGLVEVGLPAQALVERVNQLFTEKMPAAHYATAVYARASSRGDVELCNAGHFPPLVVRRGAVSRLDSTGVPVGLFGDSPYEVIQLHLEPGDTLFLYSDGLIEATDAAGEDFGTERLARILAAHHRASTERLAAICLSELDAFTSGAPRSDDLTLMVVRRIGEAAGDGVPESH